MAVRPRAIGLLLIGVWLGACGAKSLSEPGDSVPPAPPAPPATSTSDRSPSAPPAKPKRAPGVRLDQGDPLGECKQGFLQREHPDRDCNCISDGVCFDTKAEACACICPRDSSHNTCVSQWDCEKNSRTEVSCYAI